MTDDLCYLGATAALEMFRRRRLSPLELTEALLARIDAGDDEIQAFSRVNRQVALAAAKESEARYQRVGAPVRRLEGVPVAICDLHPIEGQETTFGASVLSGTRANITAPTVDRLLRAGAVPIGRTRVSELGLGSVTRTLEGGPTRSPIAPDRVAGGACGGAGAAVAAGFVPIADALDSFGGARIPAAACGVFGYKPPHGRNPGMVPWNLDHHFQSGLITRDVEDAVLVQNVVSGAHPDDAASHRQRLLLSAEPGPKTLENTRIGLSYDLGLFEVDPRIRDRLRALGDALANLGARVDEVRLDWDWDIVAAYIARRAALAAADLRPIVDRWRFGLLPETVAEIDHGATLGMGAMTLARQVEAEMYAPLSMIMQRHVALLCPTLACPAPRIDAVPAREGAPSMGFPAQCQWYLTYPFNMLGQTPVASVPMGRLDDGAPVAAQIVGRSYDDVTVFRVAEACAAAMPWSVTPDAPESVFSD